MATTQQFETVVTLNTQQAKNEIEALQKKIDDLKKKKEEALKSSDSTVQDINKFDKQIKNAEAGLKSYQSNVAKTIETVSNLSKASLGEVERAQRALKKQAKAAASPEEYKQIQERIAQCTVRIDELKRSSSATMAQYNRDIAAAQQRAAEWAEENKLIDTTLRNISGSSLRQLETSLRLVNEQLKDTDRNSEAYKDLANKAKLLKKEIAAINQEQEVSKGKWQRFTGFFNVNWGAITQGIAAVTGLSVTIRKCTNEYAAMNQEMYNVTKYTGQTIEEVEAMNESFKRLNTRTAREDLNKLAQDAGRLGITNREMIEEFVDGADKINVALGDDLGDGAVAKIGKLAQMFGEDKTKGLRGAMLATGSAVNELAQSSSASAGYIVDFTADLSGVGYQAGMTQAQIMGLASTLDQNMQEEATSSTVFSQLITKMFQDPMKFAKLANIEVSKFTNMLKTDANGALLEFLQAMSNRGGFDKLAPMFSQMGLEGTRAVGVLSAVASHLDQVREAQAIASQSYKEGTSVLNEFNVQNDTVQAELDKAKKRFSDLCIELGEKLMPIAKYSISLTSLSVKTLYYLTELVSKHIGVLTVLATSILFYNGVLSVSIIKEKALLVVRKTAMALDYAYAATTNLLRAALVAIQATWALLTKGVQGYIVVMRAARIASLTNPWTALATVLTTVGVAVYYAIKAWQGHRKALHDNLQSVKEANAVQKQQQELSKKVADSYTDEKLRIQQLTKIIRSNAYSIAERRSAIAELQKIVPKYHASISKEGALFNDNSKAIKDYIDNLDRAAMAEAIYEKKKEIAKKRLDLKSKEGRIKGSIKAVNAEIESHPNVYKHGEYRSGSRTTHWSSYAYQQKMQERGIHEGRLSNNQSEQRILDAQDRALDALLRADKHLSKAVTDLTIKGNNQGVNGSGSVSSAGGTGVDTGGSGSSSGKKDTKKEKYEKEAADLKAHLEDEQLILKTQLYNRQITEDEYNKQMYEKKQAYYVGLVNLQTKYSQDTTSTQQSMVDAAISEAQRLVSVNECQMREGLDAQTRAFNSEQLSLIQQRAQGLITEEEYNEKMKQAEVQYHRDRLSIIQEFGGDEYAERKWLLDRELEEMKSNEQQKKDAHERYEEEMTEISRQKAEARRAIMQQAFDSVNQMLSGALSYSNACADAETAKINAAYDKQIEAAGNNSARRKAIEEKRDKELAAAKKKANKRAMVIQIAQATAQTAQAAINAYSSAAAVPIVGHILAPIAAATAVAAGMLQIATIKKQQQAQAAGYYEGGFTGGSRYRREAGVVHEGEFVANHNAVNNPSILPALRLIDEAQRNNTVSSLTAADISRSVGQGGATVVSAPSVVVNTDNSDIKAALDDTRNTIGALSAQIAEGIEAKVYIDGPHGVAKNLDNFKKMQART